MWFHYYPEHFLNSIENRFTESSSGTVRVHILSSAVELPLLIPPRWLNEAFGRNKQVKTIFSTMSVAMAGLVLARVVDPVTAQQVVGIIAGMGV